MKCINNKKMDYGGISNLLNELVPSQAEIIYLAVRKESDRRLGNDICRYTANRQDINSYEKAAACVWKIVQEQLDRSEPVGGKIQLPMDYPFAVQLATSNPVIITRVVLENSRYVCVAIVTRQLPKQHVTNVFDKVCEHAATTPRSVLDSRLIRWCTFLTTPEEGSEQHAILLKMDAVTARMDRRANYRSWSRWIWFLVFFAIVLLFMWLCATGIITW